MIWLIRKLPRQVHLVDVALVATAALAIGYVLGAVMMWRAIP